jgi:hypothetical protein
VATVPRYRAEAGGWWFTIVLFLSGIAGGVTVAVLAQITAHGELRVSYFFLGPLPLIFSAAAWAGGVLAGWLVAMVVMARTPGRVRCPRCGTANEKQVGICRACDLSLA